MSIGLKFVNIMNATAESAPAVGAILLIRFILRDQREIAGDIDPVIAGSSIGISCREHDWVDIKIVEHIRKWYL